jgi:hypothetical protein
MEQIKNIISEMAEERISEISSCAARRFVLMRCHHSIKEYCDGLVAEW